MKTAVNLLQITGHQSEKKREEMSAQINILMDGGRPGCWGYDGI